MGIRWKPKPEARKAYRPWTIARTIRREDGSLWLLRTRFVGWWRKPTLTELESFSKLWGKLSSSKRKQGSDGVESTLSSASSYLSDDGHLVGESESVDSDDNKRGPRWTLEDELGTPVFAVRGWARLVHLAEYLAGLVDGRTLGQLATGDTKMFERVIDLASVVKAAAQWFTLDHRSRPPFVVDAVKYLDESRHGQVIWAPLVVDLPIALRTGPVATRQGGRGAGGRIHSLHALVTELVEKVLGQLSQEEIAVHLDAYRAGAHRNAPGAVRPKQGWVLPWACAELILVSFGNGTLADLLREQDFRWDFERQLQATADGIANFLDERGDITGEDEDERRAQMQRIARRMIRASLNAIGISAPRELFRDRRAV